MNFLTNLNLNRNELQNAVIQPLAVAPSSPKAGQIYYNSGDKFIYRFDGDNWSPIGVLMALAMLQPLMLSVYNWLDIPLLRVAMSRTT